MKYKKGLILIFGILIMTMIFCYLTFSEARIEIWPVSAVFDFEEELLVKAALAQPDFSTRTIPGKFLEVEKEAWQQFQSSGTALKKVKAEGVIRVYNNYHDYQILVATTRFLSSDGKLFRSKKKVSIPSGQSLDVEVQAAESGEEYNIRPSTFSIPGLAGTPRYTAVYGKSFSPMTGGVREEVPQVTKDDLEQAQNTLVERLKDEGKKVLEEQAGPDFVLLEKAQSYEVLEVSSFVKVGQELEQFNFQVKLKSRALVFEKKILENFVKEYINSQLSEGKKLYEKSLEINYEPEFVDLDSGKIKLSLEFSAKIYSDVDEVGLKGSLKGKELKDCKDFLESQPGIATGIVEFWPFWVRSAPLDLEKIKIKLNLD